MKLKRILVKSILANLAFFVGLFLSFSSSHAATLDQLVQEALTHNPDLAAAKARWQQASHKAPQVGSLMDPVLSFAFSNSTNDELSSDTAPMNCNVVKWAQAFPYPGRIDGSSAITN